MYNYWQIGAENGVKVPLASNQVVGGSNPSGRANHAILTMHSECIE